MARRPKKTLPFDLRDLHGMQPWIPVRSGPAPAPGTRPPRPTSTPSLVRFRSLPPLPPRPPPQRARAHGWGVWIGR